MEIVDKTHLLAENPIDASYGATIHDFDDDGELEVFVATQNGPNHLYKRVDGVFVDLASAALQDPACSAIGVAAADMTGNGLPDIYVVNTATFSGPLSEPDRLFANQGGMLFEDVLEHHPDRNIAAGRSVAWTDPLGTLRPGLYLCNYGAPNKLFVNGGEGAFRNVAAVGHGLGLITGGRAVVSQDLFGSGAMDVFCVNETAPNTLFRNLGQGRFEECAQELGLADPGENGRGLVAADLDRDGRLDLVWANWEGPLRVMLQREGRRFEEAIHKAFLRPSRARTLIAADLDNDGWLELFLNNIDEPNRLFRCGPEGFEELDPGLMLLPDGSGTGATCGDLDGDGMLELYICHGETMPQRNRLFACAPNGNAWVRVAPLGPTGVPAIGARVELSFERPMVRCVDGGSGYLCQMEPVCHFGLGASATVPPVAVRWTDGRVLHLDSLKPFGTYRVPHPG